VKFADNIMTGIMEKCCKRLNESVHMLEKSVKEAEAEAEAGQGVCIIITAI